MLIIQPPIELEIKLKAQELVSKKNRTENRREKRYRSGERVETKELPWDNGLGRDPGACPLHIGPPLPLAFQQTPDIVKQKAPFNTQY